MPGVKGLIPNGRNEDGTLRNIEFTVNIVTTSKMAGTFNNGSLVYLYNGGFGLNYYKYDNKNNCLIHPTTGEVYDRLEVASVSNVSGVITSLTPKTAFHAVDYNDAVKYSDKAEVVGWGMPDYSAEVSAPSKNTVAQTDIYVKTDSPTSASGTIYINDVSVANGWEGFVCAYVPKGATFRVSGKNSKYYPLKGVN